MFSFIPFRDVFSLCSAAVTSFGPTCRAQKYVAVSSAARRIPWQ